MENEFKSFLNVLYFKQLLNINLCIGFFIYEKKAVLSDVKIFFLKRTR